LSGIKGLLAINPALLSVLVADAQAWDAILLNGFVQCPMLGVRSALQSCLSALVKMRDFESSPRQFFQPRLLQMLNEIDTTSDTTFCTELLGLLGELLAIPDGSGGTVDLKSVSGRITQLIIDHPFLERTEKVTDPVFCSLLGLAAKLVARYPELQESLGASSSESLLEVVVHCLFDLPDATGNSSIPPPKCKSPASRTEAFTLLEALCREHPVNSNLTMRLLEPNHYWPHSGDDKDYNFEVKSIAEDSRQTYAGLVNLACICYMNASNQQLFMIPKLRQNILAIDWYDDADDSKSLIYNLQHVFGHLQETSQRAVNPKPFCNVWTDEMGDVINVTKQEDAHGYVNRLVENLSEMMKGTKHAGAFKEVLGGTYQHQMIGKGECKHFKVRSEEFVNIQVEIKQKKNLVESLQAFVQGEMMAGDNAIRCEPCGNIKRDTLRRTVIDKLPPTLVLVLKRFELCFVTFQPKKVNDKLEFPIDLDMKPFTAEALTTADDLVRLAETKKILERLDAESKSTSKVSEMKSKTVDSDEEKEENDVEDLTKGVEAISLDEKAPAGPKHPDEYYRYKLRGVVVHTGTAHGGHYYSFIQERLVNPYEEGRWFKFNDTSVTPFDIANLEAETFGGSKGSLANGYLLFYDRIPPPQVAPAGLDIKNATIGTLSQVARFANKMTKIKQNLRSRAKLPSKIFAQIWQKNLNTWRDRNVYDPAYFSFLWDLVSSSLPTLVPDTTPINDVDLQMPCSRRDAVTRLATRFVLVTLIRAKDKGYLRQWISALKTLYTNNVASSVWLLNCMCAFRWAFDLFNSPMRNDLAELCKLALANVSPLEQKKLFD
jgi:ubiquitin C-terminal hydrolase